MKYLFTVTLFLIYFSSSSQSRFMVITNRKDVILRLDTTNINQKRLLPIEKGKYILKCWAPNSILSTDTISVLNDTNIYLIKRLQYTESYLDYRQKLKTYHIKRIGTLLFTFGYTLAAVFTHLSLDKSTDIALEEAQVAQQHFNRSIATDDLVYYKSVYGESKNRYNKNRNADNALKIISAVIIPVGIYATIYFYKNTVRPEYHESPQLTRFDIRLNDLYSSQPSATFLWKF